MQECLLTKKGRGTWYLDSGCSKHMTGDEKMFISLERKRGGKVTLGDNTSCQVLSTGTIRITDFISIEKVLFVDGLKHSLLSISQLYDKGVRVYFTHEKFLIDPTKLL